MLIGGTVEQSFDKVIAGMLPGMRYRIRAGVSNETGVVYGPELALATPSTLPPGDTDGHGAVSQSELDGVLAAYWPSSPWLRLTNSAGLGTSDIVFQLNEPTTGAYTVETSTNLVDWRLRFNYRKV